MNGESAMHPIRPSARFGRVELIVAQDDASSDPGAVVVDAGSLDDSTASTLQALVLAVETALPGPLERIRVRVPALSSSLLPLVIEAIVRGLQARSDATLCEVLAPPSLIDAVCSLADAMSASSMQEGPAEGVIAEDTAHRGAGYMASSKAIGALSGAAATSATLGWLGGGALATGGAGLVAGAASLALGGPVLVGAVGLLAGWLSSRGAASGQSRATEAETQRKAIAAAESAYLRQIAELRLECHRLQGRVSELEEAVARGEAARAGSSASALAQPAAFAIGLADDHVDPVAGVRNLQRALSVLLRYVAALSLADYSAAGAPDPAVRRRLKHLLSVPVTDGAWHSVVREVAEAQLSGTPSFFAESPGIWLQTRGGWSPLLGQLQELIKLRNADVHGIGATDQHSAGAWLAQALPIWRRVVALAAPLLRRRLVVVERLIDHSELGCKYHVRWLMGENINPRSEIVDWGDRLRQSHLYLLNDGAPDGDLKPLALSPFLAWERCEVLRRSEAYSLDLLQGARVSFSTFRFPHEAPLDLVVPAWLAA